MKKFSQCDTIEYGSFFKQYVFFDTKRAFLARSFRRSPDTPPKRAGAGVLGRDIRTKHIHNIFRRSSTVEQLPVKEMVPGSNPGAGAKTKFLRRQVPPRSFMRRGIAEAQYIIKKNKKICLSNSMVMLL